ncbi:hypothetical protein E9230_001932 [Corynebacterium glutamicum]|nr:hypothetical protein [Corynebacterium glutamicum]
MKRDGGNSDGVLIERLWRHPISIQVSLAHNSPKSRIIGPDVPALHPFGFEKILDIERNILGFNLWGFPKSASKNNTGFGPEMIVVNQTFGHFDEFQLLPRQ